MRNRLRDEMEYWSPRQAGGMQPGGWHATYYHNGTAPDWRINQLGARYASGLDIWTGNDLYGDVPVSQELNDPSNNRAARTRRTGTEARRF